MALPPIYVGVVGIGGVGAAFLEQLATHQQRQQQQQQQQQASKHSSSGTRRILVQVIARSTTHIVAPAGETSQGISLGTWQTELQGSSKPALTTAELISILDQAPGRAVLVDNTASADLPSAYPDFLERGISVVTANKKGFAGSQELWDRIHGATAVRGQGALCYHEASVGAGLPVLSTLRDLLDTGDTVQRIEGVLSGTMSFLFNQFAPVAAPPSADASDVPPPPSWSHAVNTAQALGYTEPDPRDDLNGQDVARKCTILARLCGMQVAPGGVAVQSLIPDELQAASTPQDFLQNLPAFDARMDELKNKAVRNGKVLRFVASVDVPRNTLSVGLQEVDPAGPIAGLRGSDNIVSFVTSRYPDSPLVIQGAGAGAQVTAMGVLADLLRVARELR